MSPTPSVPEQRERLDVLERAVLEKLYDDGVGYLYGDAAEVAWRLADRGLAEQTNPRTWQITEKGLVALGALP